MDYTAESGFRSQLTRRKLLSLTLLLFTLAIGVVIGTVVSRDVSAAPEEAVAPDAKPLVIPQAEPLENEFTRIAKQARSAVVNIRVEALPKEKEESGSSGPGSSSDDMFRRFFGIPDPFGEGDSPRRRPRPGEGSGVIVDEQGYIITNHHVVEGADRIRVRLFDSRTDEELRDAKLIGFDPETDLAVIKIDVGEKLNTIPIGNSDAVQVGDWAIAVGSPFGFKETVTVGIISAKAREVDGSVRGTFQRFLQTDAAINPGNSGGPLLNIRGQLIGVNTAIVSRSGGSEGLGFAMPSKVAVNVYNQIIKHGKVRRGSIGISFNKVQPPALLRSFGADNGGVLVTKVTEDGPAEEAGMQVEDVIVEIAGQPIKDGDELISVVAAQEVDSTVPVVVLRDGKRTSLDVKIADRSVLFRSELGYAPDQEEEGIEGTEVMFGIEVSNLTRAQREQLGFDETDGVLVTGVEPASFADDIGILPEDIIVMINRGPVASIDDVRRIQDGLKSGDDVAVKVMRRGPSRDREQGFEWTAIYLAGVLPQDKGRF